MARKIKLLFDGRPNKMKEHRVPFSMRPRTGEFWTRRSGLDVVVITTVDPYGRWYNYERVEWEIAEPEIKFGTITQSDILDTSPFNETRKIEFND